MKLKEIPGYLSRRLQLSLLNKAALTAQAAKPTQDLIISLTSIDSRLTTLHLVIRSLLSQTLPAEKIILWLHFDLQGIIPRKLLELQCQHFEILFTNEKSPHRKLTETLRRHAEKRIVTCDDDMLYPADWLERLIEDHLRFPDQIIAHECRRILSSSSGDILPYREWVKEQPGKSHANTIAIGYGGSLYPPGSLPKQTLDTEDYLKLSDKMDDLWFKAMSLKAGTQTRRARRCAPKPTPIFGTQRQALKRNNVNHDMNRAQWLVLVKELGL